MGKWTLFITIALFVRCPQLHTLGLEGPSTWCYLTKLLGFTVRMLIACASLFYTMTYAIIATILRNTLPRVLTSSSVIQILRKITNFPASTHSAFPEQGSIRSVVYWCVLSWWANVKICFVWPGPLSTANVKFANSSLGVVCVAPEVVPVAGINCQILNRSQSVVLIAQIIIHFFRHILDSTLNCWTLNLGSLICCDEGNC